MSYTYAPKPSQTRQKGRGAVKTNAVTGSKSVSSGSAFVGKPGGVSQNPNFSKTKPQPITSPVKDNTVGGRGRGRGSTTLSQRQRGRKTMDPSMNEDYMGFNQDPQSPGPGPGPGQQPQQTGVGQAGRMKRQDAFTMISPNEKKRQEISSQAARETENYERYKASQKTERVSYVGTVGGNSSSISEGEARRKLQKEQQHAKFNRLQKSQQYRADMKRREDEEYQLKKDQARQQAQENKIQDGLRQNRLREEHKRTNEAFLKRIEREQKMKKYKLPPAAQPADSQPKSHLPEFSECPVEGAAAVPPSSRPSLEELVQMYPNCDRQILQDLLEQCHGDIDAVSQLIG